MNQAYNVLNILPYHAFGLKYQATETYAVGKNLTRAQNGFSGSQLYRRKF